MPKFTFLGSNASGYVEYGSVRFETGEAVEVKDNDENADLIERLSKNQEFKMVGKANAPEVKVTSKDERAALRAEYQAKFGKKPFSGWGADILRAKLA